MDSEVAPSPLCGNRLLSIGTPSRIAISAFGAFLGGSLWRIRGENGWGSMWGLLAVGAVYSLFIFSLYGNRRKLSPAALGVTAVAFMFTSPAWGTLNDQITGVIFDSDAPEISLFINPLSGVFFMLCMGFATPILFACLLGRGFSERKYRLRDYLLLLFVYFAATYLLRFTLAPLIVNLIQPQAAQFFEIGLKGAGVEGSAFSNYVKFVFNEDGIRDYLGGRNYSASVTAVAKALASVAVLITVRLGLKDRFAAKTAALVCGAFAFSITVTDVFLYIQLGGWHQKQFTLTSFFPGWSLWEYFTGFFAFLIITAVFTSKGFAKKVFENDPEDEFSFGGKTKVSGVFCFLFFCIAAMSASFIRPAIERFGDSKIDFNFGYVLLGVTLGFWIVFCVRKGFSLDRIAYRNRFYVIMLCALMSIFLLLYFCVPEENEKFLDMTNYVNVLMLVSSAASLMLLPAVLSVSKKSK